MPALTVAMSAAAPLVSIVATVYRSAPMVKPLVDEIVQVMEAAQERFEIILVDDRSPDDSWEEIQKLSSAEPRVRALRLRRNRGQQIAASAGVMHAQGDAVVIMDGDMQNPTTEIPCLLAKLREGFDVVYAVAHERNNWRDALTSWLFWWFLRQCCGVNLVPHQLMLRVVSKEVAQAFPSYTEALRSIAGVVEDIASSHAIIQVKNRQRGAGKSNYNLWSRLHLMLNIVISLTVAPLNWLMGIGFAVAGLSAAGAAYQVYHFLAFDVPAGFTSLIITVAFFGSLLLMALGFVGRYLAVIVTEVRHRPLFHISDRLNLPHLARE
jgi:polyisoprenyl-phosphate glycosyltransferase